MPPVHAPPAHVTGTSAPPAAEPAARSPQRAAPTRGHSLASLPTTAAGAGVIQPKLTIPVGSAEELQQHRAAILERIQAANAQLPEGQRADARFVFENGGFFSSRGIEIDYSARHLTDQYPQVASYLANQFGIAAEADHPTQVPLMLENRYGGFFSKHSARGVEDRHRALLARGVQAANAFDFQPFHEGAGNAVTTHDFSADPEHGSRDAHWLEDALENSPGLVLGEQHNEDTNRDLLASRLGQLKQAGVNTLYLEAIRSDYQDHVNNYLNGGAHAQMSPELHRFLRNKTHGGVTYLDLLQRVKAEGGLRVVGIDAPEAGTRYRPSADQREMAREITMNQFAHETITADAGRRGQGKYVVFGGGAHSVVRAHRENDFGAQGRVPGLSEMLNIPAFTAERPAPVVEPQDPPLEHQQLEPPQLQQVELPPPQQLPPPEVHPLDVGLGSSGGVKPLIEETD
jgi:hypothetical protein